jgi:hypothetical protein
VCLADRVVVGIFSDPCDAGCSSAGAAVARVGCRPALVPCIPDRSPVVWLLLFWPSRLHRRRGHPCPHLVILEELLARSGKPQPRLKFFWLPQVIAFAYYQQSWLLSVIRPKWSYRLNADFEDHAEHEYMLFVDEHSSRCRVLDAQPTWPARFGSVTGSLPNASLRRRVDNP